LNSEYDYFCLFLIYVIIESLIECPSPQDSGGQAILSHLRLAVKQKKKALSIQAAKSDRK